MNKRYTPGLRLLVSRNRWTGHGEGGQTTRVELNRSYGDIYDSTEEDYAQALLDTQFVNEAIRAYEKANSGL